MEEIWKDIEGYEGLYQVSNMGRVKSLNYHKGKKERVLKSKISIYGYKIVVLSKENKTKSFRINRLVGKAFIPNPDNLPCVNHRNENKLDDRVENLEWCDYQYNNNYGTRNERVSEKMTNNHLISKKVYQYDKDMNLIKVWESTQECQRKGYNHGNISSCCNGKLKTHKGYIWSYNKINQ